MVCLETPDRCMMTFILTSGALAEGALESETVIYGVLPHLPR